MRAAIVALLLFSASRAEADVSAESFLRSIYTQYLAPDSKGVTLDGRAALARWFTPSLVTLLQRDRDRASRRHEVGALDGDPFIDAQDWQLSDLQIAVAPSPSGALGKVSFVNAGTKVALTLDLVKVKTAWRIADIHWPDGSLVELLTKAR